MWRLIWGAVFSWSVVYAGTVVDFGRSEPAIRGHRFTEFGLVEPTVALPPYSRGAL